MFVWPKRIFLFVLLNFLVCAVLFFCMSLAMEYFDFKGGEHLPFLIIFYSLFGMGGAFISLWFSKFFAIRAMGVEIIHETEPDPKLRILVEKVGRLAQQAGIKRPAVGIYTNSEVNAFATGPSKKNSLVAVSSGLLNHMDEQEVEGVLAHEVSHIANGDMVTMSLLQGVMNTMVYLVAFLITEAILARTRGRNQGGFFLRYMMRQLFASLLFIPCSMLLAAFSRFREYRADAGGARFAGREKMLAALQSLANITNDPVQHKKNNYNYFMISNHKSKQPWLMRVMSTHPPIQDRIRRLQHPV